MSKMTSLCPLHLMLRFIHVYVSIMQVLHVGMHIGAEAVWLQN